MMAIARPRAMPPANEPPLKPQLLGLGVVFGIGDVVTRDLGELDIVVGLLPVVLPGVAEELMDGVVEPVLGVADDVGIG